MSPLTLEELVKEQFEHLNIEHLVKEILEKMIKRDMYDDIKKAMNKRLDSAVEKEIKVFFAQPIVVNDGWGKTEKHVSFEAMFKSALKSKIDSDYKIKRELERVAKNEVDKFFKDKEYEVGKALAELITRGISSAKNNEDLPFEE